MAITDIQISEELETNAPSIKYSGDEGPKSPQEMEMMADALLQEEYDKYVYDLLEQRPDATPMSLDEFSAILNQEKELKEKWPAHPNGLFLSRIEYPFLDLDNSHNLVKMLSVGLGEKSS